MYILQYGILYFWKSIAFYLFYPEGSTNVGFPINSTSALLMFNQYFLFVLVLPFWLWDYDGGKKSSSQASSGHVLELQKSSIQGYKAVVWPI